MYASGDYAMELSRALPSGENHPPLEVVTLSEAGRRAKRVAGGPLKPGFGLSGDVGTRGWPPFQAT